MIYIIQISLDENLFKSRSCDKTCIEKVAGVTMAQEENNDDKKMWKKKGMKPKLISDDFEIGTIVVY